VSLPYVLWRSGGVPHACVLEGLTGVERQYDLNVGRPVAARFPPDASLSMSPDHPYDMLLTDSLENIDFLLVVSPRLQQLLAEQGVEKVEYLPVAIHDHRGKVAGNYFIVHPLDPVDCLDIPACGAKFWNVDPDNIMALERLAVDAAKIPASRALFRPKAFFEVVLVRRDLARAIDAAGIVGVRWLEVSSYPRARG
jgi:hypothetical protein